MKVIEVPNPDRALQLGIEYLEAEGNDVPSRHGSTLEAPEPVCTVWENPRHRVAFSPLRDANPFFHLMEAIWIIGGRDDVETLTRFNSKIGNYSDDGVKFNGSYGARIYEQEQLFRLLELLIREPDTRRAVISIYDGKRDLGTDSKDIPCNVSLHFIIRHGQLHMNVFNRSNDIVWGAYGANIVQFSMIQEWVCWSLSKMSNLRLSVGTLRQLSMSYHAYIESESSRVYHKIRRQGMDFESPYTTKEVEPSYIHFDVTHAEANEFLNSEGENVGDSRFLSVIARPMYRAWKDYKAGDGISTNTGAWYRSTVDWLKASHEWLIRRQK